jgi:high-affinity iron transporter
MRNYRIREARHDFGSFFFSTRPAVSLKLAAPSLWSSFGHRVNLGLFLQVSAVFLMIFVVQLLIYGFHELTEANIFPYSEPLHIATEPYGPDGLYGKYLTYLLVLMPMGWLAFATMFGGRKDIPTQTPAQVN